MNTLERRCPACGSTEIKTWFPVEFDFHNVSCELCGAHWRWVWALFGYSNLRTKEEIEKEEAAQYSKFLKSLKKSKK